jgi:hypothetical protein
MAATPTREAILSFRLADVGRTWLEVTCGCGAHAYVPCPMLARQHGALVIADVLPRLRCTRCGARPAHVAITDFPGRVREYPDTWVVELT